MRKALMVIAAVVAAAWLLTWMIAAMMSQAIARRAESDWPLGLGTVSEIPRRYPPAPASVGAIRLASLSRPLDVELTPREMTGPPDQRRQLSPLRNQIAEYVTRQILRANPTIDPAPAAVAKFLEDNQSTIASVRNVALSGEMIAWAQDVEAGPSAPMPRLSGHMHLTRILIVSALDRARRGDAGAWEDLRAAWTSNRNLLERPEIISVMIGLATARLVNGAARKMPLPAPAWLAEMQSFDYRRAMLAAHQAEAWATSQRIRDEVSIDRDPNDPSSDVIRKLRDAALAPYTRLCMLDEFDRWRRMAIEIAASNACDLDRKMMAEKRRASIPWWNVPARTMPLPNLASIWQRVYRFRAEIEATQRALDLRAGRPPRRESACSDGNWVYSAGGMRFSKRLTPPDMAAGAIPVEFWLTN